MRFVCVVCRSVGKRIKSALCWMVTTAIVCALVLGILYGRFSWFCWLFYFSCTFFVESVLCEVGVTW